MTAKLRMWAGIPPPAPTSDTRFREQVSEGHRRVDEVERRLAALRERLEVLSRR